MKYQIGENIIQECENIYIEFMDGTSRVQLEEFLYVNPSMIKCMSVKGLK